MKKTLIAISLAAVLLMSACSDENEKPADVQKKEPDKQVTTSEVAVSETQNAVASDFKKAISNDASAIPDKVIKSSYSPSPELSDDIHSYEVQIFDDVYSFPMSYKEFISRGWKPAGAEKSIAALGEGFSWFRNGNVKMCFRIYNPDAFDHVYKDCYICGVTTFINESADISHIFTPGGFQLYKASKDEIVAAYGEPASVEESDSSNEVIYEYTKNGGNSVYAIRFNKDGIMDEILVGNSIAPDGFVMSPASPDVKLQYTKPQNFTDNIQDCIIEFYGDLYSYPMPLQALIDNGCVYSPYQSSINFLALSANQKVSSLDDTLASYFSTTVNVEKTGMTRNSLDVINTFDKPCLVRNALVKSTLSVSEMSGGIKLGMTTQELESILESNAIDYTLNSDYSYYTFTLDKRYNVRDYANAVTVTVSFDDEDKVDNINVRLARVYD